MEILINRIGQLYGFFPTPTTPEEISTLKGNFRTPERVSLFGDAGASSTCYFYVAENVRVHDIEARNFALDGVMIARVRNCRFDKMHVHHNGRWGISVVTDYFQNVEFNDCVVELNEKRRS